MSAREFLLTRPSRDVTNIIAVFAVNHRISTHTPLAGRDLRASAPSNNARSISTHTPLAGRDLHELEIMVDSYNFYSHAPRGT